MAAAAPAPVTTLNEDIHNGYDYVNEDAIPEDLTCIVCSDPLLEPIIHTDGKCGRAFCARCVASLDRCPTCRGELKTRDEPPRMVVNLLAGLKVRCKTCTQVMDRGDFAGHYLNRCIVTCVHGCGVANLTRARLLQHSVECPLLPVVCPDCNIAVIRQELAAHARDSCQAAAVARIRAACSAPSIELNVGGRWFTTSLATLMSEEGSAMSMFFQEQQQGGRVFIDRDGDIFYHVLTWLRAHELSPSLSTRERLLLNVEAQFWGLPRLQQTLLELDQTPVRFTADELRQRLSVGDGAVVVLSHANLSNMAFAGCRTAVNILRADASGADFTSIIIRNSCFVETNMQRTNLHQAFITDSDFSRANFHAASLREAKFTNCIFTRANMSHADLTNVTFAADCIMYGVIFADATLVGTTLPTHLRETIFTGANLRGTKFQEQVTDLSGAVLAGCDLREIVSVASAGKDRAQPICVDLYNADLRNADLTGAIVCGCNVEGLQAAGARGANYTLLRDARESEPLDSQLQRLDRYHTGQLFQKKFRNEYESLFTLFTQYARQDDHNVSRRQDLEGAFATLFGVRL